MEVPPSGPRRRWRWMPGVALAALVTTGCGSRLLLPEPVTRQGEDVLRLWRGSALAALGVGALIWALVWYAVIRFRNRGGEGLPSQKAHNVGLEVLYTATPLVVVAVLFAFTVATQSRVTALSRNPDLVVEAVGFQWQWQFRYPEHAVVVTGTPDEPANLVLPVGSTVRLRLSSPDVIHSFWVPRFLEKRDMIPGVENEIDVDVTRPGTWVGRCAEFCGLDHYRMSFSVTALAPPEFARWLQERRGTE